MAKTVQGKSKKVAVPTKQVFDFTNVKEPSQFSPKRKKAGDYEAVIKSFEPGISKKDNPQWVFALQLTSDASATYGYYCGLDTDSAWKIRNLIIAAGMKAPKKKVSVDASKLIGKTIGLQLEDDEYEGREKSTVSRVFPTSELADSEPVDEDDDDEDEEDDDADTDAEDDDEDEDDDEEESDDDEDDSDEEDDDDSDDDEEDEDDEDEEDEEPAPKKGKKAPAKAAKAAPAKSSKKAPKEEPKKPTKKTVAKAGKKRKSIDIDDL